jgi:DNA repair protein NreA
MADTKSKIIKRISGMNFKYCELGKISHIDSISPPGVFIGSGLRYPLVNVGILSPVERDEKAWLYDDEKYWADNDFEMKDVIQLRNNLLNSRFQSKVQDSRLNKKLVEIAKEIAISCKPVDIEVELKTRIRFQGKKDRILTPHGINANLKQARISSNTKIDQKVEKVINEDIKASEGIKYLYENKFSEYTLNKILSVGVLGLKKNKKLVPTRWSITATDDMIGKILLKKIRGNKWLEDFEMHFGEFFGNQYLILFFPSEWSFELIEIYQPGSSWNPSVSIKSSTDYESYFGRKNYAFSTAGGYYATRLAILEYLDKIKKQASVLVLRIETPTYWAALGVWVVREGVRKALKKCISFSSRNELIENTKKTGKTIYNFDYESILRQSKILRQKKEQKNLRKWL